MSYTFLSELTYADVAFEATGSTPEELFVSAAKATTESMVALESVQTLIDKTITLTEPTLEKLLFSFLEEIVLLKDSEQLFLTTFSVTINKNENNYHLVAQCKGDTVKPDEQDFHNDVKAVTYHEFKLEQNKDGWKATVILDV